MKTSSGLLLGVLFTLVVVIVALVIYFNTRPEEEKTVTSTGPSPTLPGISDLTVSRTDSPDSDSEPYTIEPYTIEYAEGEDVVYEEGDNEKALSKNITFKLNWTNNDGFDDVKGIKIEQYIKTETGEMAIPQYEDTDGTSASATFIDTSKTIRTSFMDVSYSITGNGKYSFVGKNRFKISAILTRKVSAEADAKNQEHVLYDGRYEDDGTTVKDIKALDIKSEDLTATIGMALALTKTFELELQDGSNTGENAASKKITNTKYTFKAVPYKSDPPSKVLDENKKVEYKNVELISQDDDGKKFKFRTEQTDPSGSIIIGYWGLNDVPATTTTKAYKVLSLAVGEDEAAIITFANSSKGTGYKSLKIVAGTTEEPIDMYLYGINNLVAFRTLDDPVVSKSYKLSNTRHWAITT